MAVIEAIVVRLRLDARQILVLVVSRRCVIHDVGGRPPSTPVVVVHALLQLRAQYRLLTANMVAVAW